MKECDYSVLKPGAYSAAAAVPGYVPPPPPGAPYGAAPSGASAAIAASLPPGIPFKHFVAQLDESVTAEEAIALWREYHHGPSKPGAYGASAAGLSAPSAAVVSGGGVPAMPKGDGSYEQTVVVNNSAVAGVIGKGGLTIKNIITVSGARVQISQKDPANPSADRTVQITGEQHQVATAHQMVMAEIDRAAAGLGTGRAARAPPPPPPGYPQGGYGYPPPASYPGYQHPPGYQNYPAYDPQTGYYGQPYSYDQQQHYSSDSSRSNSSYASSAAPTIPYPSTSYPGQ